jgi:hypothetical protein
VQKKQKDLRARAAAFALLLSVASAQAAAQQQGGTSQSAPRWDDRIAGVEIWRIPNLPRVGRVIREDDASGRPIRCAAAARVEDPGDPRLTDLEFGFVIEPESQADDEPDNRELRDRVRMYLKVRFEDSRTGAPIPVARPIWHLRRPVSGAAWIFSLMDGEGFVRAEAPLAGASDDTLGDVGGDISSQTALVTVESPSGPPVRIVDSRAGGFTIDQYWALSRCVCQSGEPELRYLGCRVVNWR